MQYQRITDEASIIVDENGESQFSSRSLKSNNKINHIRKIIFIILSIEIILSLIFLILEAHVLMKTKHDDFRQGIRLLGLILVSLVYFGYGYIVVYRYYTLGIIIFAWTSCLQYLFLCGELLLNIVFMLKHKKYNRQTDISYPIGFIMTIIPVLQSILTVITCKYAFKLFDVIKTFKRDVLEQI